MRPPIAKRVLCNTNFLGGNIFLIKLNNFWDALTNYDDILSSSPLISSQ